MAVNEEQAEEIEVLASIFEDDEAFKQINEHCVQYKIGEDNGLKSFLIEFLWPPDYPNCVPEINLNSFYNNRVLPEVKQSIIDALDEQSNNMLGGAMTYSLIDWAKENHEDLMALQPLQLVPTANNTAEETVPKKKEKKEQLSKAQKRKIADRVGAGGERPRGWNWIDPIKHLSQTGSSQEREDE